VRTIGRIVALVLIGLAAGCDLEFYRTAEGVGVIGPNGGYFVCTDNNDCSGH
jgi:hypothetical protein